MKIINLTPHTINLIKVDNTTLEIPPSGELARVAQTRAEKPAIEGIEITLSAFGTLEGLPPMQDNTFYLVSGLVLSHPEAQKRPDVFAPGEAVRDEAGRVIGCKGLSCSPAYRGTKTETLEEKELREALELGYTYDKNMRSLTEKDSIKLALMQIREQKKQVERMVKLGYEIPSHSPKFGVCFIGLSEAQALEIWNAKQTSKNHVVFKGFKFEKKESRKGYAQIHIVKSDEQDNAVLFFKEVNAPVVIHSQSSASAVHLRQGDRYTIIGYKGRTERDYIWGLDI